MTVSTSMNQTETEITLSCNGYRALVSNYGASLRRFFHVDRDVATRDILWGYCGKAQKRGGQGDVLIPFPGRIRGGEYHFEGQTQQLERNDKEGPNAIHGFVRTLFWNLEDQSESMAQFRFELTKDAFAGYPFSLGIQLRYELTPDGLECKYTVRNSGKKPAPVGAGFHPYFTVGTDLIDDAHLVIPATDVVEFAPDLLPTGAVIGVAGVAGGALDFRKPRRLGALKLNHCYTGLLRGTDGLARVKLENPATRQKLTVWLDQSFPYLVMYTGDAIPAPHARQALAIEPMTCATDAFNHLDWVAVTLAPGQDKTGRFGITGH
ncbi:MAG: aldose epimerase [Deltaproteobacteria bacterium]|nr:aldose epimerase [Deltaproteobacteria bacterium]